MFSAHHKPFCETECETIKDIIFDYLNEEKEEKEKPSMMSGAAVAIGTAMAPVLANTAYESRDAIKNVGSFLGARIWSWPVPPSNGEHCNLSASTPLSLDASAELSPELSSSAVNVSRDETVVVV